MADDGDDVQILLTIDAHLTSLSVGKFLDGGKCLYRILIVS